MAKGIEKAPEGQKFLALAFCVQFYILRVVNSALGEEDFFANQGRDLPKVTLEKR